MKTELMTPASLAAKLGKSPAALAQWRYLGIGPRFIKLGRNVRYRASDVEEWLDRQTVQRTGEPGYPVNLQSPSNFRGRMSTPTDVLDGGDAA